MKTRLLSIFAFVLAIAISFAIASDKGEKTAKKSEAKKETQGCCMTGKAAKAENDCSDKAAMDCDPAEAKAGKSAKKSADAKAEVKKEGEAK
ncbi:MAG: hypothetical protein KF749_12960 [Bacteroidetes bacterium]|nr:hypothetical protein [Bacteroidota bacterium]MCW5894395.1 hypothetical protein [Bacteroidota bacterium]